MIKKFFITLTIMIMFLPTYNLDIKAEDDVEISGVVMPTNNEIKVEFNEDGTKNISYTLYFDYESQTIRTNVSNNKLIKYYQKVIDSYYEGISKVSGKIDDKQYVLKVDFEEFKPEALDYNLEVKLYLTNVRIRNLLVEDKNKTLSIITDGYIPYQLILDFPNYNLKTVNNSEFNQDYTTVSFENHILTIDKNGNYDMTFKESTDYFQVFKTIVIVVVIIGLLGLIVFATTKILKRLKNKKTNLGG